MRLIPVAAAAALAAVPAASAETVTVYFGTYTGKNKGQGVYVSKLDTATGALTAPELAAEAESPAFLAVHPSGKFVYAANEVGRFEGKPAGSLQAFAVDPATGKLTALNRKTSGGGGPCHVSTDPSGKVLLAANYGGGSVTALPINADGSLGDPTAFIQHVGSSVNPGRQKGPHAHSINVSPDGRFAMSADLGLDKVLVYRLDAAKGTLTPHDPPSASVPAGSGPRHFSFRPDAKFAFVCDEMTSAITSFRYDAEKGVLTPLETLSTLPADYKKPGNSTAECLVHPSGKFVYVSNRGHDSIAGFAIDAESGKLTALGQTPIGGKTPRNFGIDPTGQWLLAAGQSSGTVHVFKIDAATGGLTPVGKPVEVPACVCVRFLPIAK
jgi:6-phosphogluconolactonase